MTTSSDIKLRPLHDRVVVQMIEEDTKSAGGIIIPDTAKEKPTKGEVKAVGEGMIMGDGSVRPLDVKVGDRVLFNKWASNGAVTVEGQEYLVMKEDEIIAVMN